MIEITNGIDTYTVTKGAFKTVFERQGYKVAGDGETVPSNAPEPVAGSTADVALVEKPIGQWSKAELRGYAESEGIDLTGAKSVAEVREIIKNHIG